MGSGYQGVALAAAYGVAPAYLILPRWGGDLWPICALEGESMVDFHTPVLFVP